MAFCFFGGNGHGKHNADGKYALTAEIAKNAEKNPGVIDVAQASQRRRPANFFSPIHPKLNSARICQVLPYWL
jgi:hypothetical protein